MVTPLLWIAGIGAVLTGLGFLAIEFVYIQALFALLFGLLAISYVRGLGFDETMESIAGLGAVVASYVFINPLTLLGSSILGGVLLFGNTLLKKLGGND